MISRVRSGGTFRRSFIGLRSIDRKSQSLTKYYEKGCQRRQSGPASVANPFKLANDDSRVALQQIGPHSVQLRDNA